LLSFEVLSFEEDGELEEDDGVEDGVVVKVPLDSLVLLVEG